MTTSAPARVFSRQDIQLCVDCDRYREGRWVGHSRHPMTWVCGTCGSRGDDE